MLKQVQHDGGVIFRSDCWHDHLKFWPGSWSIKAPIRSTRTARWCWFPFLSKRQFHYTAGLSILSPSSGRFPYLHQVLKRTRLITDQVEAAAKTFANMVINIFSFLSGQHSSITRCICCRIFPKFCRKPSPVMVTVTWLSGQETIPASPNSMASSRVMFSFMGNSFIAIVVLLIKKDLKQNNPNLQETRTMKG